MANRTPRRKLRSLATLIAMFALMTLSLGSALGHNSTGGTGRDSAPAAGVLTTTVRVLTDGGDVDEASEQEDVDEANDDPTDENEADENDQGQDEQADENDDNQDEQAGENDDNQQDEADDSGDEGGDD